MQSKFLERAFVATFVIIILFAIHQLLASHFPFQQAVAHGAGDWAAWVSAMGTCLAFAGTIYLANSETRRRRKIEDGKIYLTLNRIIDTIRTHHSVAEVLLGAIDKVRAQRSWIPGLEPFVTTINRLEHWEERDLEVLLFMD